MTMNIHPSDKDSKHRGLLSEETNRRDFAAIALIVHKLRIIATQSIFLTANKMSSKSDNLRSAFGWKMQDIFE